MAEELLQQLLAATDSTKKAAWVAHSVLENEEPVLAELVPVLAFLRWFDELVVAGLLPETERLRSAELYARLIELPFVERVSYGFALHDLTRKGLIAEAVPYQRIQASQAADIYGKNESAEGQLERLYCLALAEQSEAIRNILDGYHLATDEVEKSGYPPEILSTLKEARLFANQVSDGIIKEGNLSDHSQHDLTKTLPNSEIRSSKRLKTFTNEAIILWASYFDELAAVSFAHEFRKMGIQVLSVAIHSEGEHQKGEFVSPPHHSLREALEIADEVDCLVIPSSPTALAQFEQDPLLWQLIGEIHQNGARIVMGEGEGQMDKAIAQLLPPREQMIFYPDSEKLLLFARWVAYLIIAESERLTHHKKSSPPLIRMASDSIPGSVAGAIAGVVREYGYAEVQSVGAAAGNQMLKSIAIAKSYLAADKLALFVVPNFSNVEISGSTHSAIRLFISAWPESIDKLMSMEQVHSRTGS